MRVADMVVRPGCLSGVAPRCARDVAADSVVACVAGCWQHAARTAIDGEASTTEEGGHHPGFDRPVGVE